ERSRAAVDMQGKRVNLSSSMLTDEIDSLFLAVALKLLRSSVEWARNYSNGQRDGNRGKALDAALTKFDAAVPGVEHVRDLQIHAEEYEKGSKDRHLAHIGPPLAIWWEHSETTTTTNVGGYSLDAAAAVAAATELADTALTSLHE